MSHIAFARRWKWLAILEYASVIAFVAMLTAQSGAENSNTMAGTTSDEAADQFEHFIGHTPPIEDLFVEIRQPDQSPSFYHAKWQTNGAFIGCNVGTDVNNLQNATNLTDYYRIYSRFDNIYWQKIGHDLYCWTNNNLPDQLTNSITFSHNNNVHWVINQSLNGGLDELPASTIRWIGDKFSCSNDESGNWYVGSMSRDSSGKAESLDVSSGQIGKSTSDAVHLRYEYFYSSDVSLYYFPSRIEWSITDNYGHVYKRTMVIHSIKLAPEPMKNEDFSLDPLLDTTNITVTITISNNMLITTPRGNRPGAVPGVAQDHMAKTIVKRFPVRTIYFIFAAIIFAAPLIYFLFNRKQQ